MGFRRVLEYCTSRCKFYYAGCLAVKRGGPVEDDPERLKRRTALGDDGHEMPARVDVEVRPAGAHRDESQRRALGNR